MKNIPSLIIMISLLSFVLIVNCNSTKAKTSDSTIVNNFVNSSKESNIFNKSGSSIETVIPESPFHENQTINIEFNVKSSSGIKDITFTQKGFSIISSPKQNDNQQIMVSLMYLPNYNEHEFVLNVTLKNSKEIFSNILGIKTMYGLFLSSTSMDEANEMYFLYQLSNGIINDVEYKSLVQDNANNCIEEETEYSIGKSLNMIESHENELENPVLSKNMSSMNTTVSAISYYNDTFVNGTLKWKDDNNNLHPIQYTVVDVYDADLFEDTYLGSTYTDVNGYFSFGFLNDTFLENGGLDIYIGFGGVGENTKVYKNIILGSYHYLTSSVTNNVSTGSTTTKNITVNMSNDAGRAIQISQALIAGNRYVKELNGSVAPFLKAIYPSDGSYQNFWGVYIDSDDYRFWDTILHEYGHHLQEFLDIEDSPGGTHYVDGNMADINKDKDEGIRLAWGEAWPTVYANLVTKYYSSILQNIDFINDNNYDSSDGNGGYWNFSLESGYSLGEACEGSIIAVLYDLFDSGTSESYDTVSLGHAQFWNLIKYSKSTTFSEFINYSNFDFYVSDSKLGPLLSEYGMASKSLRATTGLTQTPPTFSWTSGGGSISYPNNSFNLVFYDINGYEILRTNNTTLTTYTLTSTEWHSVMYSYGKTFTVAVKSYQINSPTTGGYISQKITYTKPTLASLTESLTFKSNSRYIEKIIELAPGQYKDFYVTFESAGQKIIQTFGPKDSYLEIYDMNGNFIDHNDDQGYGLNAWLRFVTEANTQYRIRVRFFTQEQFGMIKLGITPASNGSSTPSSMTQFENIFNTDIHNNWSLYSWTNLNSTNLWTITINQTQNYTLLTGKYSPDKDYIDMYLYLIDPTSTDPCLSDDDDGGNLQAKITTQLEAGKTYLLIISTYNITTQSGYFSLNLNYQ